MFNIQYMLVLIDCYRLCTLTSRLFLVLRPEQYPSVQDFQTSMTYKSPSLDRTTWPRDICLQNKVETNEIKLSRGILMSSMKYSLSLNTSYKSQQITFIPLHNLIISRGNSSLKFRISISKPIPHVSKTEVFYL